MAYLVFMGDMVLPITPESITYKFNNQNKTVNLINEGEVNQIKPNGLTEVSFDCVIPMLQQYPFSYYPDDNFIPAKTFRDYFASLKHYRKRFLFKVLRNSHTGGTLFDSSIDCTIEDFSLKEDAKNGLDLTYSITLKQYKEYGSKKLVVKTAASGDTKAVVEETRTAKEAEKTYTVVSGDCLWNIAKKQLGNGSKWGTIYTLNQDTIESTAKEHVKTSSSNGHWIYPGTVLKLPS